MEWTSYGQHQYYIDRDIILWKVRGDITLAQHSALFAMVLEIEKQHGHAGMIAWPDRSASLSAEVRRNHARLIKQHRPRVALAVINSGPVQRALGSMTTAAARLFSGIELPMRFCATEAEGRAWLASVFLAR